MIISNLCVKFPLLSKFIFFRAKLFTIDISFKSERDAYAVIFPVVTGSDPYEKRHSKI